MDLDLWDFAKCLLNLRRDLVLELCSKDHRTRRLGIAMIIWRGVRSGYWWLQEKGEEIMKSHRAGPKNNDGGGGVPLFKAASGQLRSLCKGWKRERLTGWLLISWWGDSTPWPMSPLCSLLNGKERCSLTSAVRFLLSLYKPLSWLYVCVQSERNRISPLGVPFDTHKYYIPIGDVLLPICWFSTCVFQQFLG